MGAYNNKDFLIKASPLFLAILIDGAGAGLFFPLLNALIMDPSSSLISWHASPLMRNFLYGLLLSIFMLFWFFGAAITGDLSDRYGRRKGLALCLFGTFIGYLLSAFAVVEHSFMLLILGRVIDGFTAGSQPIAQAGVIDMSPDDRRTRNMSYVLFAASFGFIIGPLIGGVLSDSHLVSWFDFATPLYFAAIISLANTVMIWFFMKETLVKKRGGKIRLTYAFDLFVDAFKHEKIRNLSFVLIAMFFGWTNYFSFISLFLLRTYGYAPIEVSIFWSVLAVGFGIATGYLVGKVTPLNPKKVTTVSFAVVGIGMFLTGAIHVAWLAWVVTLIIGMAQGVGFSILMGMFSEQVDKTRQGWVMGITGSLMAGTIAFVNLFASFLNDVSASTPMIFGSIAFAVCIAILLLNKKI